MARPCPARVLSFCYNHDAAHQAAHISSIMGQIAQLRPHWDIVAAAGTPQIEAQVRTLVGRLVAQRIRWVDLSLGRFADGLLTLPNTILPAKRLARLKAALPFLSTADAIVSTERTCLRIKRRLNDTHSDGMPKFIYVPHGSGDRNVAYHSELQRFDYFLLSGKKIVDEMVSHGIAARDQCTIIGYPKFDVVDETSSRKLFANDLPTIIYNPHFDPRLSSWYDYGPTFLKWVATKADTFNCVFAPHVMLFRKKLHISPEYKTVRLRPDVPSDVRGASNLLIDTDSPALFDMSYTNASDIYVGDVSSQVYEFLRRPRACFFIDAAGQGGNAYPFWSNGPVATSMDELESGLEQWRNIAERFRQKQTELFAYTIDTDTNRSAALRGANALEKIVLGCRRFLHDGSAS